MALMSILLVLVLWIGPTIGPSVLMVWMLPALVLAQLRFSVGLARLVHSTVAVAMGFVLVE